MRTLICGSVAFDSIMVFADRFKNHILPDQIHILNVAFLVPEMRKEFGGCAGNIAYSLKLLGGDPVVMATVGQDHKPYTERMAALGLDTTHVRVINDAYTAQAFITTDLDDNQITAFHPGAMSFSDENSVLDAKGISLGIVSPDGKSGMIKHANELHESGVPFIFDPGQGLPMFDQAELVHFIGLSDFLTVNDYEAKLLQEKVGKSIDEIAKQVKALIVTKGGEGSVIFTKGEEISIPAVSAAEILDPTGCGDSYRSGLLYGIQHEWDWKLTGQLASLVGAIKIASRGPQNHLFDKVEIESKFKDEFGTTIKLN
ncbi:MAG: carbohydrate kinase family protein [Betaproteobacteria bacterium]